ncbi:cache domain-containing protein [Chloroflexi bacterium TSY]|nr:cache domain-containing protein [Chloroflexi bacterium TSY]
MIFICLFSVTATSILAYNTYQKITSRTSESLQIALNDADRAAFLIREELARLKLLGDRLANDLSNGTLPYYDVQVRMEEEVQRFERIFGLAVVFEPNVYLNRVSHYAPDLSKNVSGDFELTWLPEDYRASELYTNALSAEEGLWVDSVFDENRQTEVVAYVVPFFHETEGSVKPAGVVYVKHSIDTLVEFLNSVKAEGGYFSYLLSEEGRYITHPDPEFTDRLSSDVANERDNERDREMLRLISERARSGEPLERLNVDPATKDPSWIIHRFIPLSNWSVGFVFDRFVGQERPHIFVRDLIFLAVALIVSITALAGLIFRVDLGTEQSLWRISITFAGLCLITIIFIWYLETQYPPQDPNQTVLLSDAIVEAELSQVDAAFEARDLPTPLRVPTGIMLETIGFSSGANENVVSGYIWQKYPIDAPADIQKGFLLTDAVDPQAGKVKEVYRTQKGDTEIIGWHFRSSLRQEPSVNKFPLDEATVQVQIWPEALDDRVVLVPDLDSYSFVAPRQLPGLVDVLVLENWESVRTYFSYRQDKYNAVFGSEEDITRNFTPDLYYNVIIRRLLLSPIVAYTVTILVVASLMFAVLIIHVENAFNVLTYAASLFFVVAVSQVGLRGELEAAQVVYLEYGYILLYVVILIVSVNSILYYSDVKLTFIKYRDNLIPKLLYWPLVSVSLLIITVLFFLPPPEQPLTNSSGQTIPSSVEEIFTQ